MPLQLVALAAAGNGFPPDRLYDPTRRLLAARALMLDLVMLMKVCIVDGRRAKVDMCQVEVGTGIPGTPMGLPFAHSQTIKSLGSRGLEALLHVLEQDNTFATLCRILDTSCRTTIEEWCGIRVIYVWHVSTGAPH